MRKRILLVTLYITVVGLLLVTLVSTGVSYQSLLDNTRGYITAQINALDISRCGEDAEAASALSQSLGGLRVTFLTAEGIVPGDRAGFAAGGNRPPNHEGSPAAPSWAGVGPRHY